MGRFSYLNNKSTTAQKKNKKNIRYQTAVKEKEKERRKYLWGDCGLWQRCRFDEQSHSQILWPENELDSTLGQKIGVPNL